MGYPADIAAYNNAGKVVLIVEVKSRRGTSTDWAAKTRHNILAHSSALSVPFFLLALPDRFYLWKSTGSEIIKEDEPPTFEVDALPLLNPYYKQLGRTTAESLSGGGFELIVVSWLTEILRANDLSDLSEQNRRWLQESGLYQVLRGARLAVEARV